MADLAQAQAAEREAFAVRVADLAQAQAAEREAFAVQVADLTQTQGAEREVTEVQIADLRAAIAQRQATIQSLEQTIHRLATEGTRLRAARDVNLVNAARLQIKVNAARDVRL